MSQAEVLEALERYRLLTSQQIREVVAPERGQEWTRRRLVALKRRGLVAHAERRSSHQRVWYVTPTGGEATESRRRPMSETRAAGNLQAHDLDVNEAALAFHRAARVHGHVAGWRREVLHAVGPRKVIADALLEYQEPDGLHFRFLEVDRGSEMLVDLLGKLLNYAHLYRYRPKEGAPELWRGLYPAFPFVLVIFSGRPRAELERRLEAISALCGADPELRRDFPHAISFALLSDLKRRGPFEPIFRQPGKRERLSWLGEPERGFSVLTS